MRHIIEDTFSFSPKKKTVVTVGTFDGVHLGHQKIIEQLVKEAQHRSCAATLLTFDPHPRKVLQPDRPLSLIQTLDERAKVLTQLGLEHIVVHPFTYAFSQLSAEEYVKDLLVDTLRMEHIIVGHNHRFGKNRAANVDDLIRFGKEYGFTVAQISAEQINDISISSTKIRHAILEGKIATANAFLGHAFTLSGVVVEGKQNGRTIGFPTANLALNHPEKIIPKNGVYAVYVHLSNSTHLAMMNIGTNPTVNGHHMSIEVHILDWSGDIYHQEIQISVIDRVRDEIKFESLLALQKQLEKDKVSILGVYNTLPL